MTALDKPPADPIRCRFCKHTIVRRSNHEYWTTPLGEPPAPGVALPIECPEQHLYGTTFGFHEPETDSWLEKLRRGIPGYGRSQKNTP
ncbi:hypothetical protein [Nonomuraea sediminis]|uniref:hypothetical protein n=1 Tax=Nonomuraea sediminis TaxID=2835864 RepID=UPI001BDBF97D|nr:hypothetical protein [Nonomuraea sediminis]